MNGIQKIILICAMVAVFAFDRIADWNRTHFFLGVFFLVFLTIAGIYMVRDKKDQSKKD